jgi:predicted adenine nucleotide alpha hydrolase (AANH) superfamily ATPase
MKILLHCCCAPCTVRCADSLLAEDIRPDLLWYNPNIHPYTEYAARRDALRSYAADRKLPLHDIDEYGLRDFIRGVFPGMAADGGADGGGGAADGEASRCLWCYRIRLEKTARLAAEGAYDGFSTTLLISPWQNHEGIRRAAEEAAAKYGVQFLYRDFRPRFREGQEKARTLGLYRQKYCGCIFSEEERYLKKQPPAPEPPRAVKPAQAAKTARAAHG